MSDNMAQKLISQAREIISKRAKKNVHEIGCALVTQKGNIYQSVHLEATVGRVAVCAEAIAIGMAAANGHTDLSMIVAVNSKGDVVSPCGICRELIMDYSPTCKVVMPDDTVQSIETLLPQKYKNR